MKKTLFIIAFLFAFTFGTFAQNYNDRDLTNVIGDDKNSHTASGELLTLPVGTHLYRAKVYAANRHFPEAREHFEKILAAYPEDGNVPEILFQIGRSFMWERDYESAVKYFDRLFREHTNTKYGREGLAYKGASFVRLGKNDEAVDAYTQYTVMFSAGERIESSYLNIIDALREEKKYDKANEWVDRATKRFRGLPTAVNALHARLRMEIYRANWDAATRAADDLMRLNDFSDSMADLNEVKYLKAFALQKSGKEISARGIYLSIPDGATSYYGGLATQKLSEMGLEDIAENRRSSISKRLANSYPIRFRNDVLRYSKVRGIDPRFILAIMKQESGFRANAKSPAAARGLLQLTFDTALKYNDQAGYKNISGESLYVPSVNIAIGTVYIAQLKNEFGGLYEAIAASYNGGEDNVSRWLDRTKPKEAGIFAAEVGFSETKDYVYKVMSNYRVYRELYTEDLVEK